jgi:hypothetical protein
MPESSRGDGPFWLDGIGGYDAEKVRDEICEDSGLLEPEDYFQPRFDRLAIIIAALAGAAWATIALNS